MNKAKCRKRKKNIMLKSNKVKIHPKVKALDSRHDSQMCSFEIQGPEIYVQISLCDSWETRDKTEQCQDLSVAGCHARL